MSYLTLTPEDLPEAHICCAISDKKCGAGYRAKQEWLAAEYARGYRFRRLDVRGKVFLEYGPAEASWQPVVAPEWLVMGCFWVSGRYKGQGHAKALLAQALEEAEATGRAGLVSVVGTRKVPFMSDGKWLRGQGFEEVDRTEAGFVLLARGLRAGPKPRFADAARAGRVAEPGIVALYSDRCPYTAFHVGTSLRESCARRGLPLTVRKLETLEAAQVAPSPATIFSLFANGRFVTTDLSACMESRFDRIVGPALGTD